MALVDGIVCSIGALPRDGLDAAVVIDVLRAFTVAPWVVERRAASLRLAASDDDALALKRDLGSPAVAIKDGPPVPGFDLVNSPGLISRTDLTGVAVVQRTTNGTVGAYAARTAPLVLCAALVTASATAELLRTTGCRRVAFVVTGEEGRAQEDLACADLIGALWEGRPAPADSVARVRGSAAAAELRQAVVDGWEGVAADDIDLACEIDRFDFALVARPDKASIRLHRARASGLPAP